MRNAMLHRSRLLAVAAMAVTTLLLACGSPAKRQAELEQVETNVDLPQLQERGELVAVTLYLSTSYFQYKMQDMGYEYELVKDFARSQILKLTIKVAENSSQLIEMLRKG